MGFKEFVASNHERWFNARPGSRENAWNLCHKAFLDAHANGKREPPEETVDGLCLQLSAFLASFGMYTRKSFLLLHDYTIHRQAVRAILEHPRELLWDYLPSDNNVEKAKDLLFDKQMGLYFAIRDSYGKNERDEFVASKTLITKILLGTLACCPAFDKFLKKALKKIKPSANVSPNASFGFLCKLYEKVEEAILPSTNPLPPMRRLDIALWEYGKSIKTKGGHK